MKKILALILPIIMIASCRYDDTALWDEIRDHEARIAKLETLCKQFNTNINSLQSIVSVIEKKDYVTGVVPIKEGDEEIGYTISFTNSGSVTIYHGQDGKDGENGKDGKDGENGKDGQDGKDGKDGATPDIGVMMDEDGIYYWTLFGEWLLDDNGEKIRATAVDGITPRFKIEEDFWYLSYDNGKTWMKLDTSKGKDGYTFFESVEDDGKYVYLTLSNGTKFTLPYYSEIRLVNFGFLAKDNPRWLSADLEGEFKKDNVIDFRIPNFVESKELIPTFEFKGAKVKFDGEEVISGETVVNFSKPAVITVEGNNGESIDYTVNVRAFTGLPVVYLVTDGYTAVTSKETYIKATFTLTEDIETRGPGDSWTARVRIKGRGNSTWTLAKKPYKLKFDEKVSILGEPKDKTWLLLANYTDKTMVRNATAFFMGHNSNLPYTTRAHFVEFFMHDVHQGVYQLCEDKDVSKDRINLSENGYLLEIDSKAAEGDVTFNINTIAAPINIKEPEIAVGSEQYNLVKNHMTEIENVLYGANFADPENGYAKYMNVDTFVDWYLINEITKNPDAIFNTSCYMTWDPGEKLCMGPIWDFDLAFGNCNWSNCKFPEGFYIRDASWYSRLFQDPNFVVKVKERFNHFYDMKDAIYNEINENAEYLKYSIIENDAKWDILYQYRWPNHAIWGSYDNEIQYIKRWLDKRFEWLKTEFDKM